MVLIVAFLMYFQESPMAVIVILSIALGGYILFKRRRSGKNGVRTGLFRSGDGSIGAGMGDLINLMLCQHLLTSQEYSAPLPPPQRAKESEEEKRIEATKQDLLNLLRQYQE